MRWFLAISNKYSLDIAQLDVRTAFSYGTLDQDVFMEIPEGVHRPYPERSQYVCKLEKAIYGLKNAPCRRNVRVGQVVTGLGFQRSERDACVYVLKRGSHFTILILYVDDILIGGTNLLEIERVRKSLQQEF